MGRWSEPRSSTTIHSALPAKCGRGVKDTSGELRPPVARLSKVAGGVSTDPILQLFTTCVTRLVTSPPRGVDIKVTAWEGQVAHLQTSKIERVRDASGSDGGRVDVVDCSPFTTGELVLDCEAF